MVEDGRLLVLLMVAGLATTGVVRGSRGVVRPGSRPHRTLRSPSSPRGDIPLTEIQERDAWDAGYEVASKLSRGGDETHLDPEEGFLWAIRNDKRLPYGLKEDDPSFWEYELAFREGFVAYAKNEGFEIFGGSRGVVRRRRTRLEVPPPVTGERATPKDLENHIVDELVLATVNDGELYEHAVQPLLKNLAKRLKKGRFEREQVVKVFVQLAEVGARKYGWEHDTRTPGARHWSQQKLPSYFSPKVRREAAWDLFEHYTEEIEAKANE